MSRLVLSVWRRSSFLVHRQLPSLCDLTWPSNIEIISLMFFLIRALISLTCLHTYDLIILPPNTITQGIRNSTCEFWREHEYSVQSILLLFLNLVINASSYNFLVTFVQLVKTPHANAGYTGLISSAGRSHMPWGN